MPDEENKEPTNEPGKSETDGGKQPDPPGEGEQTKAPDEGLTTELKEFIVKTVREVTGKSGAKPAGESGEGDTSRPSGSWARRIEEEAARAVREAAANLKKEEEHEKAHKTLEKVAERTPNQKPKAPLLQRLLWGDE